MTELAQGQRIDWWKLLNDLRRAGMGFDVVSQSTGIPMSTIAGYKNLDAEPKHADGSVLVGLWKGRHEGNPPIQLGSVRNRPRD
jgi:hypothetical protein